MPDPLSFPPFRLDPEEERLWRGDGAVGLRPRSFAVLRHLVERAGHLVRHEELMEAVWGDAAVTPGTLNTSIRELRKALGDDARYPRFIETVHRRGFRFVAEVRRVADVAPLEEATPVVSAPRALHGRDGVLADLESRLASAAGGARQIAFVTGDAGIGKTSVLRAFNQRHATDGGLWIAWGQSARRHGQGEPYHPVLDALDRLVRTEGGAALRGALQQFAPSWLLQLPWLLEPGEAQELGRSIGSATSGRMLRELSSPWWAPGSAS